MKKRCALLAVLMILFVMPDAFAEATLNDAIGSVTDGVYESPFLGIGCVFPEWKFDSKEQILSYSGYTEKDAACALTKFHNISKNIILMAAFSETETSGVSVQMQYVGRQTATMLRGSLGRWIGESAEKDRQQMKTVYPLFQDISVDYVTFSVDSRELPGYRIAVMLEDRMACFACVAFVRGDYLASIVCSAPSSFEVDQLFSRFVWLEEE